MNKLLLNKDNDLNNIVFDTDTDCLLELDTISTDINIFITENICVNITELGTNTNNEININIDNGAKLIYNKAGININDIVNVSLEENTSINISNAIINNKRIELREKIIHNKSNSVSIISNHGINNSIDNLKFIVDVIVPNNSVNSLSNQENKIINTNCGKSYICPNLIVDNKEVNLSHSAYIGDFDKDTIFYLKSRGIKDKECRELLLRGFLLDKLNLSDEYKDKVINFIK